MKLPILLAASAFACTPLITNAATYVVGADPRPSIRDGRIVTDAYNDNTAAFESGVKHFAYQLGATPNNPFFTADPGFNAILGSGLPQGQQLRFDVVRHLSRWDGTGFVNFALPTNSESVRFSLGTAQAIVTGTTDSVPGFSLGNIASGGTIHKHLNATMRGGADALSDPQPGLYFTALRLNVSDNSAIHSDALYIAYNNGLSATDFARGMTYLANPLGGDANFDSHVNFDDLIVLAQHYNQTGDASYFDGDFNNDRNVNFDDLIILAQHYNGVANSSALPNASASFASDWSLAQSLVPEPTSLAAIITGTSLFARGKRRVRLTSVTPSSMGA